MPQALFVVRSVVADARCARNSITGIRADHLPWPINTLRLPTRRWRAWSKTDPSAHYAAYRFADMKKLKRPQIRRLQMIVADYDRIWPKGVTRTRELLELVETASA